MKKLLNKISVFDILLILLFALMYRRTFTDYIAHNNTIYALEQLNTFNAELFASNPVNSVNVLSSKYFTNYLVSGAMKMGFSWEGVMFIFCWCAMLLYSVATWALGKYVFRNVIFGIGFCFMVCLETACGLSGLNMVEFQTTFTGMGIAFSLGGLVCAFSGIVRKDLDERKRDRLFDIAWLLVAVSCCFHIHEGLYGGATLFLVLITAALWEGKLELKRFRCIFIFVIAVFAAVLPNMLTDYTSWDDATLIDIYIFGRIPHHYAPSTWNKYDIRLCLIGFALPFVLLWVDTLRKNKKKVTCISIILAFYIVAFVAVIAIQWFFTVHIPVALFSLLALSKEFKYLAFVAVFVYLHLLKNALDRREYLAFCLTLASIVYSTMYITSNKGIDVRMVFLGIICVFMCLYHEKVLEESEKIRTVPTLVMLGIYIIGFAVGGYNTVYISNRPGINFVSPNKALRASVTDEIYGLAEDFLKYTDNDTVFLADPYDIYADWFQLVSRRSAYVTWKCVPNSKAAIELWHNRINQTLDFSMYTAEELENLMKNIECKYVLLNSDWNERMETDKFKVLLDGGNYKVYELQ